MRVRGKIALLTVVLMLVSSFLGCASNTAQKPATKEAAALVWAGGTVGSTIMNAPMVLSEIMRREGLNVWAVSSAGTVDSLRMVTRGEAQFGTINTKASFEAFFGQGGWKEANKEHGQVIALWPALWAFMVKSDSNIKHLRDFAGKTINSGRPGTTMNQSMPDILDVAVETGLLPKNHGIKDEKLNIDASIPGLVEGKFAAVQALVSGGSLIADSEQGLAQARGVSFRLIDVPPELKNGLIARGWIFTRPTKELAQWRRYDPTIKESPTVAGNVNSVTARADVPADVVYKFLELIFTHLTESQKAYPVLTNISLDTALAQLHPSAPIHPGAAKFYKDRGVWTNEFKVLGQ